MKSTAKQEHNLNCKRNSYIPKMSVDPSPVGSTTVATRNWVNVVSKLSAVEIPDFDHLKKNLIFKFESWLGKVGGRRYVFLSHIIFGSLQWNVVKHWPISYVAAFLLSPSPCRVEGKFQIIPRFWNERTRLGWWCSHKQKRQHEFDSIRCRKHHFWQRHAVTFSSYCVQHLTCDYFLNQCTLNQSDSGVGASNWADSLHSSPGTQAIEWHTLIETNPKST